MAPKLTEKEARHRYWVAEALARLEYDVAHNLELSGRIPVEWHRLSVPSESPKTRITLRVESDVVKFYKSLGQGYQSRMNDVLKTFMHAKLARVLRGADTPEGYLELAPRRRAKWGDFDE